MKRDPCRDHNEAVAIIATAPVVHGLCVVAIGPSSHRIPLDAHLADAAMK
jgi:hypothetical protein